MEFAGGGWASGDNQYYAIKLHLQEELGGPFGGTLKYCLSDNMGTLNPYLQKTGYEATVFQYIYETLYDLNPYTWDSEPRLAYDWDIEATTASGDILDGQKFTFKLYDNITWHDGEAFDAYDVNHSIHMWRDSPYHGPEMWDIYKVDIPDPHTFTMYVNETGFFEFGDVTQFYITPEHIWNEVQNVTAYNPGVADVVGTGPYYMDSRVPGEYINMKRHDDWHFRLVEEVEPTSSATEPTAPEESSSEEEGDGTPGFEFVATLAIFVTAAVVIRKRRK
jgi:ABC-type transport system substrate-binding protein